MSETKELNRERLLSFLTSVDQEILNMKSGEGRFRPGALHFEKDKASPVLFRLEQLKENPTKGNLEQFLGIAKQDFGAATAQAFKDWSHSIFPVDPIVKAEPVVKPFNLVIKDGFYDMFKAATIPLTPKQVELLEVASLKLAKAFESKIATAVGFATGLDKHEAVKKEVRKQLKELVNKSKVQDSEDSV
jgi:hypothetical protein